MADGLKRKIIVRNWQLPPLLLAKCQQPDAAFAVADVLTC